MNDDELAAITREPRRAPLNTPRIYRGDISGRWFLATKWHLSPADQTDETWVAIVDEKTDITEAMMELLRNTQVALVDALELLEQTGPDRSGGWVPELYDGVCLRLGAALVDLGVDPEADL